MQQDFPGKDLPGSVPFEPVSEVNPLILKILTAFFLFSLLFTTIGIMIINSYFIKLDDFQWIILIVVPWVIFILLLTMAFVYLVMKNMIFIRQSM
jgi:hypothetical protein